MLPYKELWALIGEIISESPWFPGSKRVKGFDEEIFQKLLELTEDFYLKTFEVPAKMVEMLGGLPGVDFTYRYKDAPSIKLKFERLNMEKKLFKVANDILGMRFVLKTDIETLKKIVEEFVSHCPFNDACSIVDQTEGKKHDDGYTGIHVNIKPNNFVFPIEIQFWTRAQALLNEYLHANIYKIDNAELNQYAIDLRNWLEDVPRLPDNDGLQIQSYVDFIYEKAFADEDDEDFIDDLDDFLDDEDEDFFLSSEKEVEVDEK
ncbi:MULTISPECIES: hypothetical protein [Bacillus]|jgi:hypothetical protein|uniref:hypothetical protein n=1 Tax=Bacillus TaxID=1386 RepID=UPI002E1E76A7|nr:hypothetical protein [Bacillus smithii]